MVVPLYIYIILVFIVIMNMKDILGAGCAIYSGTTVTGLGCDSADE